MQMDGELMTNMQIKCKATHWFAQIILTQYPPSTNDMLIYANDV